MKDMLAGYRKVIDNSAITVEFIAKEMPCSSSAAAKFARNMVTSGAWEQVWKKNGIRLVPAYREKKK